VGFDALTGRGQGTEMVLEASGQVTAEMVDLVINLVPFCDAKQSTGEVVLGVVDGTQE
jgi:hypothetical protein